MPPITEPVPTFHQDPPELDEGDPSQAAPPPAYTLSPRAPLNMYAAAGDYLYAAAPSTPFEASNCNYSSADLAATTDVQLTQEIRDLAEKLQYSPAQIFAHVSNTIEFEPYFGSLKGAMGTLVSGTGNATDQASLTIALLRASNIPARYVKGRVQFFNDQRLLDWMGAKTQTAAANILAAGQISAWSNGTNVTFSHVWVEACVPYGNYRGTTFDQTGHHWIPLDPSFKNKTYQAGIATNVSFDYTTYMSSRTFELPNEFYEGQVTDYIRTQPPRFENNTLDDVGYIGTLVPQQFDILPASLPYEVLRYEAWAGGLSSETAALPAEHRYSLRVEVGQNADKGNLTLSLPAVVLDRVTLAL